MKFRHVAKIESDGSDPIYFIDGIKYDHIYSDTQLLQTLLGKSFETKWLKSDEILDEEEQTALWSVSFCDTLDELEDHLRKHPGIVEDT